MMQLQPLDLLGLFLPPIIDIINMKVTDTNTRYLVSFLACAIVGVLLNMDKINNWQTLIANIGIVFTSAQTVHKLYWSNTQGSQQMASQ